MEAQDSAVSPNPSVVYMTKLDRPTDSPGRPQARWPESDHALYITINDILQDGCRRPFEIFINSKNMEHFAWTVALTRMIRKPPGSTYCNCGAVFDPRGVWMSGHYVPSLLAAIGGVIEQHMIDIGFIADPSTAQLDPACPTRTMGHPRRPGSPATPGMRQRRSGSARGMRPLHVLWLLKVWLAT